MLSRVVTNPHALYTFSPNSALLKEDESTAGYMLSIAAYAINIIDTNIIIKFLCFDIQKSS